MNIQKSFTSFSQPPSLQWLASPRASKGSLVLLMPWSDPRAHFSLPYFFLINVNFYLRVCVLNVCHTCAVTQRPKEGTRYPGAEGVTGSCKLFSMSARNKLKSSANSSPLKKKAVLTTESLSNTFHLNVKISHLTNLAHHSVRLTG